MHKVVGPYHADLPIAKYEIEAERPFVRFNGSDAFHIFVTTYTVIIDEDNKQEDTISKAVLALTPGEAQSLLANLRKVITEAENETKS